MAEGLLHWGRDEEFEEPTRLYEIQVGGIDYWVSAYDALDAASLLRGEALDLGFDDQETFEPGAEIKEVEFDQASGLSFINTATGEEWSMAEEYNRDPSRRVIACSEWG
ncbi:MAG: hypothetical protein R3253_13185 [Longimicrobiales bacterium]|nr:hypothetical protein [Longimicrobiales bacterium]